MRLLRTLIQTGFTCLQNTSDEFALRAKLKPPYLGMSLSPRRWERRAWFWAAAAREDGDPEHARSHFERIAARSSRRYQKCSSTGSHSYWPETGGTVDAYRH